MKRLTSCVVPLWLVLFCPLVLASTVQDLPQQQLNAFFQQRLADTADEVTVTPKTALNQWPDCEHPLLSLSGGTKLWGELSVAVSCGKVKRFVRVTVQAKGNYVVAASAIRRGQFLNDNNVSLKHGLLNGLAPQTILALNQVRDAVALRDLAPGQPIQRFMLRKAWKIRAGQQVKVVITAPGFNASSSGQALDNAAVMQSVRVRMPSGKIINGRVGDNGDVLLAD